MWLINPYGYSVPGVIGGEDETDNLGWNSSLEHFRRHHDIDPAVWVPHDRIADGTQGPEQSAHVDRPGYSGGSNYGGQHLVTNDALKSSGMPLPRPLQG
jgi:hypothetical protein